MKWGEKGKEERKENVREKAVEIVRLVKLIEMSASVGERSFIWNS